MNSDKDLMLTVAIPIVESSDIQMQENVGNSDQDTLEKER